MGSVLACPTPRGIHHYFSYSLSPKTRQPEFETRHPHFYSFSFPFPAGSTELTPHIDDFELIRSTLSFLRLLSTLLQSITPDS